MTISLVAILSFKYLLVTFVSIVATVFALKPIPFKSIVGIFLIWLFTIVLNIIVMFYLTSVSDGEKLRMYFSALYGLQFLVMCYRWLSFLRANQAKVEKS